jgi:hypothetical protein
LVFLLYVFCAFSVIVVIIVILLLLLPCANIY